MTGVRDNALFKILGFPQGLDNLSAETELPMGQKGPNGRTLGSLRVAENVDLDEEGKVFRRRGYTLAYATDSLHSLWSHPDYPYMLAVDQDGNLVSFDEHLNRLIVTPLTAVPTTRMSFAYDAGYVYYCNGFDSGRIDLEGVPSPWALQPPRGQPLLEANAAGGLAAGRYQVAITFRDDDGRESGATLAAEIELATGQGIRLLSIPQPEDPQAAWIRIYVTETDGTVPRFAQDVLVGTETFVIGVGLRGAALATQFHEPLPAGQIVRLYRGRMYVWRHNVLYWSEAMHYGQGVLHQNYLHFNDDGTLLEGLHSGDQAGMFVAAGKRTYFLSGSEPKQWVKSIAHPQGAVVGTSTQVEAAVLGLDINGHAPAWYDTGGDVVAGLPSGRVQKLHADRFSGPVNVEEGAMLLREHGGLRQLVTTLRGGTTSPLAVSDRAEAEVWKDGVRIG